MRNTRTTDIASHVLPTKDQLERADMTYVVDSSFPIMVSQYTPAMVEPAAHGMIRREIAIKEGVDGDQIGRASCRERV